MSEATGAGGDDAQLTEQSKLTAAQVSATQALQNMISEEKKEYKAALEEGDKCIREATTFGCTDIDFSKKVLLKRADMLREYYSKGVTEIGVGSEWTGDVLKLLPCTLRSLRQCKVVDDKMKSLFDLDSLVEIKNQKEDYARQIAAVKNLRLSVLSQVKQVRQALESKKSKDMRKRASEEAAEAKKKQKEAVAAAKKAAKRPRASPAAPEILDTFSLDWPSTQMKVPTSKFGEYEKQMDGIQKSGKLTTILLDGCDSVITMVSSDSAIQSYVHNFVTQSPMQPTINKTHRSIAPLKASQPFTTQLRQCLREFAPGARRAEVATMEAKLGLGVSAYWNLPTATMAYIEKAAAPTVRYQHRGQSELLIFDLHRIIDKFGQEVCGMETAIFNKVKGLSMEEVDCLQGQYVALLSGSVLVMPACCVVIERSMAGHTSYGFRGSFSWPQGKEAYSAAVKHTKATHQRHPHLPLMESQAAAYTEVLVADPN